MKTIKFFVISGIFACILILAACANPVDPSEAYPHETQEQIFQNGENALRSHSYQEAIKRFEALDVQYPFGPHTETAQLHIIYAYYMNSDYASAEAAADRFIRVHPTSPHVDYAYYMRGLSRYFQNQGFFERVFNVDYATRDLTQMKKAFNDFGIIVERYPHSYYAPAAHQYMIYLRDVMARHQLEVARYYYNHHAYVAAADRAALVVQNYQGSPRVPEALSIMASSYHQLHETRLENETLQVMQYNGYAVQTISTSYVLELKNKDKQNVFSEQTPYAQNGERNRGRGVPLGKLFDAFGTTHKNFWSMGPSDQRQPVHEPENAQPRLEAKAKLAESNGALRTPEVRKEVQVPVVPQQHAKLDDTPKNPIYSYHQNGDRR